MRRVIKILIVLGVLAAVVAGAGTLVLRSDWLGARVLAATGARLGLDIRAQSFSLGWAGDATLETVSVRMPLSDAVVVSAERVALELGPVPLALLARHFQVRTVELDRPTVFLRRSEDGRWNAQEVWTRVRARLQAASGRRRSLSLPQVVVRDGKVEIAEPGAGARTLGPVTLEAGPKEPVLWTFDLRVSSLGRVEGQMVQGPDWAHEIRFQAQDLGPLVRAVFARDLAPVRVAGRWKGSVVHNALRGEVRLDECRIARTLLQGAAGIEVAAGRTVLTPRGLTVNEPNLGGAPIHLADGAMTISRAQITLASLVAQAGLLGGRIDGDWDVNARSGEFSGSWAVAGPDPSLQSSGMYRFSLKSPRVGRKEAQVSLTGQARTPVGSWHTAVSVSGSGADWRTSQWQIQVPALSWSRGERRMEVTQAAARVDLHWPQLRLTSLSVPDARQVNVTAQLDARTRRWSTQLAVEGLRGSALGADGLDLRLAAEGDDEVARVSELHAAAQGRVVTARGNLSFAGWGLRDVHLSAAGPDRVPRSAPAGTRPEGRWHLDALVAGRLQPLALDAQATLVGQKIALGRQQVDRVQIPVQARVDTWQVEATTPPFDLLGGQWQLTGRYDLSRRATTVHVMATDLSLAAAARLAGLPVASEGQAQGQITLSMPGLDVQKAVALGNWSAQDVNFPPLVAQRAQGVLRIADGVARLNQIQLEQDTGLAQGRLEFPLDKPQIVTLELKARDWPVPLAQESVTFFVDGQARLLTNIATKTADGDAHLTSRVVWKDEDLAQVQLSTRVQGQTLEVRQFHAQTLSGSAEGTATIPLDHWTESVAQVRWQGIQPRGLQAWLPSLGRLEGTLSGTLALEQTGLGTRRAEGGEAPKAPAVPSSSLPARAAGRAVHALGPMRFILDANLANGRFGSAEIGAGRIVGYLDPARLLIDNADWNVLGGRLKARARVSPHAGKYYGSIVANFDDLNLDSLVHALAPAAGPHVGRLSGTATVLPVFDRPIALTGAGRISLTQSDLVGNGVVRTLYDTLSLRFGAQEPTGTGDLRFSLEGPALVLSSIQYFNRGVEIRGSAKIQNVNLGGDSPIEGYAVASTRVLKGLKLPGVGALDRWLDMLQTGAASVKIGGVVDQVEVKTVPLPEVLGPFRRLLWAQLRE